MNLIFFLKQPINDRPAVGNYYGLYKVGSTAVRTRPFRERLPHYVDFDERIQPANK